VRDAADSALNATVAPLMEKVDADNAEISKLREQKEADAERDQKVKDLEKAVADARAQQDKAVKEYASGQDTVKQLIDLALLSAGLLKGQALSDFVRRSYSLL
jgi:molecular chaperone HtpG